jgi:flagellar motor component MotA
MVLSMESLKQLDEQALVEMLASFTRDYTRMLREGSRHEEFRVCKEMIDKITREIEQRQKDS